MGYVMPRLPKDASPEMREMYLRHLLKALGATNPWTKLDSTPIARWLEAHPEPLIGNPELIAQAKEIADPPGPFRRWRQRQRDRKP